MGNPWVTCPGYYHGYLPGPGPGWLLGHTLHTHTQSAGLDVLPVPAQIPTSSI